MSKRFHANLLKTTWFLCLQLNVTSVCFWIQLSSQITLNISMNNFPLLFPTCQMSSLRTGKQHTSNIVLSILLYNATMSAKIIPDVTRFLSFMSVKHHPQHPSLPPANTDSLHTSLASWRTVSWAAVIQRFSSVWLHNILNIKLSTDNVFCCHM